MDPGLLVTADEWPRDTPSGEWQPLKYSNWLLSSRFGQRARPYMVHVAKTISPSVLREIREIWGDEFFDTASHRFRGQRDVYTTFLHGHYLVERWRELLLWSWVVARVGGDDDSLGEQERNVMWEEVGGSDVRDQIVVHLGMRHTLEKERIKEALKKSGEEEPVATQYVFCELCGFCVVVNW
jgi:Stealth protein CR3, conserved region 3